MDATTSDYELGPHYELPFGNKIAVAVDSLVQHEADNCDTTPSQDVGGMPACDDSPPDDDVDEDEEEETSESDEDETDSQDGCDDLLVYARANGLTTSYFEQHPLQTAYVPTPPSSMLADPDIDSPYGDSLDAAKSLIHQSGEERWDVDKETAVFLTSVMCLARIENTDDIADTLKTKDLKVDEPVLSTDPEMDLSRLRARNTVCISTKGIPPCKIDWEKDESLEWTPRDLDLPFKIIEHIQDEKLDVSRESMELLREIMMPEDLNVWEAVEQAVEADQVGFDPHGYLFAITDLRQTEKIRKQTPPLLPLSPELRPYRMPAEACEIELTSSPENLFAQEAARVEAELFQNDRVSCKLGSSSGTVADHNTSDEIESLTKTPTTNSSPLVRRKRLLDLKADTPLLPQESDGSPAKKTKTVSFPEELHTLIPGPETDDLLSDRELARQDIEAITESLKPMAQSAVDQISNEKLDELDTVLRLNVPDVDAIKPKAPWDAADSEGTPRGAAGSKSTLLSRVAKEIPSNSKKWSGLSKLERLLSWTPFPRYLGKVSLDEQFDDGSWERYMAELKLSDGPINTEPLLWKREGIRLLDDQESDAEDVETAVIEDEELSAVDVPAVERAPIAEVVPAMPEVMTIKEPYRKTNSTTALLVAAESITKPAESPQKASAPATVRLSGMQALLQKRKLELESRRKSAYANQAPIVASAPMHEHDTATSVENTAARGLDNFMGLQGAGMLTARAQKAQAQAVPVQKSPATTVIQPEADSNITYVPLELPSPTVDKLKSAKSVVVSSSMLINRHLVRQLQVQLPNLDLVERDSASSMPDIDKTSIACEADLIISSSTGLICTTLQKLRQRPLPGQSNFFGIRERISMICPHYGTLIVLVSEGRQDNMLSIRTLDERDTTAINDLIRSTTSLGSHIEISYVPGGDADLAKWIAANICRHANTQEEAKLLNDETMWERVLRAAGANPALAQTILAQLKRSEVVETSKHSPNSFGSDFTPFGLGAFVQMPAKERIQRVGPLLGGERVIARLSDVIDGGWMSAGQ